MLPLSNPSQTTINNINQNLLFSLLFPFLPTSVSSFFLYRSCFSIPTFPVSIREERAEGHILFVYFRQRCFQYHWWSWANRFPKDYYVMQFCLELDGFPSRILQKLFMLLKVWRIQYLLDDEPFHKSLETCIRLPRNIKLEPRVLFAIHFLLANRWLL